MKIKDKNTEKMQKKCKIFGKLKKMSKKLKKLNFLVDNLKLIWYIINAHGKVGKKMIFEN